MTTTRDNPEVKLSDNTDYVQSLVGGHFADDNPYVQSLRVDDNQKSLRKVDKASDALAHDEPIDDVPNKVDSSTIESIDHSDVEKAEGERKKVSLGTLDSVLGMNRSDLIPKTIAQTSKEYAESAKRAGQAVAPQMARNYLTPGAHNLTDRELLDVSIDDYTLNSQAKVLDQQGGVATGKDILNMMVVPDQSYNVSKVTGADWFTSQEGLQSMADSREALLPDQRLLFDQNLKKSLDGVESSEVQKYTELLDFMGKNPHASSDQIVEKLFLISDLAAVGKGLVTGSKAFNKMRQLSKLHDHYTAAKAAELASHDGVAEETGIPKVDAAMSGNPLKEDLKDSTLKGTTVSGSSETRTRVQDVDRALDQINSIQGVQILPNERELNDMVSKWDKIYNEMDNVESAHVTKNVDGVSIEYKTPEGTFNKHVEYRTDDFGGFVDKSFGLPKTSTRYVWSPKFLHGEDSKELVDAAVIGHFKKTKTIAMYNKALKSARKGLNRKSLRKVNELMSSLNGKDIDASYQTLVHTGIGGKFLSPKEADSLLAIRRVFDHMHEVNNSTLRREMELQNLRETHVAGENHYAKSYEDAQSAQQAYRLDVDNNQVAVYFEGNTGSVSDLDNDKIKEMYDQGYRMVKSSSKDKYGWFKDDSENRSRYAMVMRDDVKELPDKVLPYIPNYVPRLREEANFFIRQKVPMQVNGNNLEGLRTVAWAKTKSQAEEWLALQEKATTGKFDRGSWTIDPDRKVGVDTAGESDTVRMNGGMYRGSRSQTGLVYAGDNTSDEGVVDALHTLQGAIRYTADRMNLSEVRQTLRHRWLQDASSIDKEVTKVPWSKARSLIKDSDASPQLKSKLLASHDQITNVSGIPSRSEQEMQGIIRAIGESFDNRGMERLAKYFYKNSDKSPLGMLKGGAFHMMLGMFNPAQYLVQMMGGAVAVGANPASFTKALPRIMAAGLTDTIDDSILHGKALKALAKGDKMFEGMTDDVEFWRRSGMYESVLKNNADFDSSGRFMPLDAGAIRRGWSKLGDLSTLPYEAGELASSRISFFTALEHYKSLMGDKWMYSEENLQKVVSRAESYRLNMSSANKAEYQKGLMSLPTQFKSTYTRSMEVFMGKDFSMAEKSRIALSQVALFGAAGVPIFSYFKDNIAKALLPDNPTPEDELMISKGSAGWLINGVWNVDAEVSDRLSMAGDIVQDVQDTFFSKQTFLKSFFGASFTSTDKATSALMNMMAIGKLVIDDESMNSLDKMGFMSKQLSLQLANIPTSSRRLLEAWVLQTHKEVRDSNGVSLYQIAQQDYNLRTVIARAMGFSSQETNDIYETNQGNYARSDKVKDLAKTYTGMINNMMVGIDAQDEEGVEAMQHVLSMLHTGIKNDSDREAITEAIMGNLKGRDLKDKVISQWLENHVSDLLSAKAYIFPTGEKEVRRVESGKR